MSSVWQWRPAPPRHHDPHHVTLRPADRERGHRAAGAVSGRCRSRHLGTGTEHPVREGNLRVAEQVAEQIKQYIVHNQRVLQLNRSRAAGRQPGAVAAVADPEGLTRLTFPSCARSRCSVPAAGWSRRAVSSGTSLTVPAARNVRPRRHVRRAIEPRQRRPANDHPGGPDSDMATNRRLGRWRAGARRALADGRPRQNRPGGLRPAARRKPAPDRTRRS